MLGEELLAEGWAVRGTSRGEEGLAAIGAAGIEAAPADPERPGTLLDLVGDVAVVHYLLGSAVGDKELVAAIHGPRLERLLEKLVDTPVRGFVYEASGSVDAAVLDAGAELVAAAAATWRIPVEVVTADPSDLSTWSREMVRATRAVLAPAGAGKELSSDRNLGIRPTTA
jgi:uncharacterized protein YbjT (DUF2867 family)